MVELPSGVHKLRALALHYARKMVADQLAVGSSGNISARDPQSGMIVITPSALAYDDITAEEMAVVNPRGTQVAGKWRASSELPMHLSIYAARRDVHAIVHSHAPFAAVFAVIHEPIPMVLAEAAGLLGGEVPVSPYARTGTTELGSCTVEHLGNGYAVLLANHGLVTIGDQLHLAYQRTLAVESCARVLLRARAMGANPKELPLDETHALFNLMHNYKETMHQSDENETQTPA